MRRRSRLWRRGEVEGLRDSIGAQQRFMETQVVAALARIDQRLDAQAEVVRELSDVVGVQRDRWTQYRSAVEKLREITDVTSQPMQLPENL